MQLRPQFQSITRRPSFIFAVLSVLAIVSFLGVARLVKRYREQEKALGRRMYARGLTEQRGSRPEPAIEDFRAALLYDRDNSQYQLSLARALRDSGRTDEAETYLLRLWEGNPEDGAVNLALGRLAARRGSVEDALHYYHNAIYGIWPDNADSARSSAEFELIDFLIKAGANPQAQAELITVAATHPEDASTRIRIAQLFMHIHDYEHALVGFQAVWNRDHGNAVAAAGAGEAAFALGRYSNAESYLRAAAILDPSDTRTREVLQMTTMLLESDPFARGIPDAERLRRVTTAFTQAGSRLESCAKQEGVDLNLDGSPGQQSSGLAALQARWLEMKPKMRHLTPSQSKQDLSGAVMDLVSEIEQQTTKLCGEPSGMDEALFLISQERASAEIGAEK